MKNGIHEIDGSKVWLGFDDGKVAKAGMPQPITRYGWDRPLFPEFVGDFAPPLGAELVGAACWSSLHLPLMPRPGPAAHSGQCDLRHAYYFAPSRTLEWNWLLLLLHYDYDYETWSWNLVCAADRSVGKGEAARWLLETFWYWQTARVGEHAQPVESISRAGLLSEYELLEISQRIQQPLRSDPADLFRPRSKPGG